MTKPTDQEELQELTDTIHQCLVDNNTPRGVAQVLMALGYTRIPPAHSVAPQLVALDKEKFFDALCLYHSGNPQRWMITLEELWDSKFSKFGTPASTPVDEKAISKAALRQILIDHHDLLKNANYMHCIEAIITHLKREVK